MGLVDRIAGDLTVAMKAKDAARVSVIRMLKAALANAAIECRAQGKEFTEDAIGARVQTEAKRVREAMEDFRKGNRDDLVAGAEAELAIMQEYLPQQMNEDDVRAVIARVRGVSGASAVGPLTGAVMKELQGKADGALVRRLVEEVLR